MKYISLAAHNNELVVVNDMDAFTTHFCYSKKQRYGAVEILAPTIANADEAEIPAPGLEIEEIETTDEDDL